MKAKDDGTDRLARMASLLRPRHIAVVGASGRPANLGYRTLKNLERIGFDGKVSVVNPQNPSEFGGYKVSESVSSLESPVDVCVVTVRSELVLASVQDGLEAGCHAFTVFAGGFAEVGGAGIALQSELTDMCTRNSAVLCGPNSVGNLNLHDRSTTSFGVAWQTEDLTSGPISVISQSGAVATTTYAIAVETSGLSHVISAGNEAALDIADYMDYLLNYDSETRVICFYYEAIRRPRKLLDVCRRAREAGREIVALKGGRGRVGAQAAVLHTGALADSDTVVRQLLTDMGVIFATSPKEMGRAAAALANGIRRGRAAGRRVAVVASSGGGAVTSADAATEAGLEVSELDETTTSSIAQLLGVSSVTNPLDVSLAGFNDSSSIGAVIAVLASDPNVDQVVGVNVSPISVSREYILNVCRGLSEIDKPSVFISEQLNSATRARDAFGTDVLVLEGLNEGFRLLERLSEPIAGPLEAIAGPHDLGASARLAASTDQHESSATIVTEPEVYGLLAGRDVEIADYRLVHSLAEAQEACTYLGDQVAVKVVHRDIPHRATVGLVKLDVYSGAELARVYEKLMDETARIYGTSGFLGILLQRMVPRGAEVLVGVRGQVGLGDVLTISSGGTSVESSKVSVFALLPMGEYEFNAMIARCVRRAIVPAELTESLAATVHRLVVAWDTLQQSLAEVEFNPVRIFTHGSTVLDALGVANK